MSNIVQSLIEAGWTGEQFDDDPSAVAENDVVEVRVTTDPDGGTWMLLGDLDTQGMQLWHLGGDADPVPVLLKHQPELSAHTVPVLVRDLVSAGVVVTGALDVPIEADQLDGLDRLETFRDAFWQVVPFEGLAIARLEGDEVDVDLIESTESEWEMVLSHDEDFEDVYALDASPEAAQIIISNAPGLTTAGRGDLVKALQAAGIEVAVAEDDEDE